MSAAPAVSVRGLGKRFGTVDVLTDLSFDVQPGERVCVWGPSGAGKSTLLHVLGLMTPPSTGALTLFGRDAAGLSMAERARWRNEKIGFLFQFHHLLPDLSLLENVMIPLLIRRRSPDEAAARSRDLLVRLGLGHRLEHRPADASGGERQRAALARALVGEPALLLADEPTGNLDRGIGREVEALMNDEARARGATLILVTHDETLAAHMDRRLGLVDGRLAEPVPGRAR
ncbi:MAG TPA: ABC transporter ATP-binding protein [Elusimicrobiota bacterium]|jgi:lipoprotein-releasing system ATP-binding protein|nr:ABC transporter ATP-binding protein [Elusimicrobiota bacterium]HMU95729.1 ABC transporter ATP-binding protein [Elusimicrobiota bacterium]HMX42236.1 ABC transporter ATP-binding protein [Elusimicrobiota bacterium]HMX93955.1 ABC transporter ATP-binding protein [Elusimicrobiota bacterium]HNA59893.1 ABC transporter ATP-binding protein [Elusimicrobiota bacterium]